MLKRFEQQFRNKFFEKKYIPYFAGYLKPKYLLLYEKKNELLVLRCIGKLDYH